MGKLIALLSMGAKRYLDRWLGIQLLQAPALRRPAIFAGETPSAAPSSLVSASPTR